VGRPHFGGGANFVDLIPADADLMSQVAGLAIIGSAVLKKLAEETGTSAEHLLQLVALEVAEPDQ
jgi:hypothetical protein